MSPVPGAAARTAWDADWPVLERWLDAQDLPSGPSEGVEPIAGGTQNVLVRFRRGGRGLVLRRPPPHPRPGSGAALLREVTVLRALDRTAVPHPSVVAVCDDESVIGCVFYVMDLVEGFSATTRLPESFRDDPARCRELVLGAIDVLASLGDVDHRAAGLDGLGRPEGFLERQVPRWLRELESYRSLPGYRGAGPAAAPVLAAWLEAHRPPPAPPGIMHGDFHLGNLLFCPDDGRVSGVVDWEMCTIGDPLLDLGRFLATWPAPGEPMGAVGDVYGVEGLPARDDLVARYAEGSGRDLSHVDWYTVLACFKLGIILEGTHARACAGQADPAVGRRLHQMSQALFRRAEAIIQ